MTLGMSWVSDGERCQTVGWQSAMTLLRGDPTRYTQPAGSAAAAGDRDADFARCSLPMMMMTNWVWSADTSSPQTCQGHSAHSIYLLSPHSLIIGRSIEVQEFNAARVNCTLYTVCLSPFLQLVQFVAILLSVQSLLQYYHYHHCYHHRNRRTSLHYLWMFVVFFKFCLVVSFYWILLYFTVCCYLAYSINWITKLFSIICLSDCVPKQHL